LLKTNGYDFMRLDTTVIGTFSKLINHDWEIAFDMLRSSYDPVKANNNLNRYDNAVACWKSLSLSLPKNAWVSRCQRARFRGKWVPMAGRNMDENELRKLALWTPQRACDEAECIHHPRIAQRGWKTVRNELVTGLEEKTWRGWHTSWQTTQARTNISINDISTPDIGNGDFQITALIGWRWKDCPWNHWLFLLSWRLTLLLTSNCIPPTAMVPGLQSS
jgi:hypothetical protein